VKRDHLVPRQMVNRLGRVQTVYVRPETAMESASYGVTPFKGAGRTGDEVSFDDPYYGGARYRDFQRSLYALADDADVNIEDEQRALGLWEGTNEPSAAVGVSGSRRDIELVARSVARKYDQWAVRVIYRPGSGVHRMYSFTPGKRSPEQVMATLRLAGIAGARVTEDAIELADAEDLTPAQLSAMESVYGRARVEPVEVVRVFQS